MWSEACADRQHSPRIDGRIAPGAYDDLMLLVGAFLAIGFMLGIGLGGRLQNLARMRLRLWWLAPFAVLLQSVPISAAASGVGALRPVFALFFSFVVLFVVASANWRLPGFPLVMLGVGLNLAVIGLNQGMPVSAEAVRALGEDPRQLADAPPGARHHLATEDDLLRPLGDVVPFDRPFDVVVSVGDLLMYAGAAVYLGASTLYRRPDPEPVSPPGRTSPRS